MTSKLLDAFLRLRSRLARPVSQRVQRLTLGIAVVVFLGGGVLAARTLELDLSSLGWGWIVASMVIGVPLSAAANAAEYAICSQLLTGGFGVREAVRVSVVGTAANLLPLPGAVLVRVQALVQKGSGYRSATAAVTMIGLSWIGVSASIAAVTLYLRGENLAWLFLLIGVLALVGGWLLVRRLATTRRQAVRIGLAAVAVEVGLVLVAAFRLDFVLRGLHVAVDPGQSLVLALSGSLGAAVGVFPGGLGLREVVAAALAPLVSLPASMGFLASALSYVTGLLAYSPLSAAVAAGKFDDVPALGGTEGAKAEEGTNPFSSDPD